MIQTDYERIAAAIEYIRENFRQQPDLDAVAAHVHLSPFHFQRLFTAWAGVSPKKFLQYTSLEHAKYLLSEKQATLFDATLETGLSGTGRLHDLFVTIEGMTPGEYKNGGASLEITYQFAATPFGKIIIAATAKGICHLSFTDTSEQGLAGLTQRFPNARLIPQENALQEAALRCFQTDLQQPETIRLHLKGTAFQLKVWDALLHIPSGRLSSYGQLANRIAHPGASRAVGTAIGDNPVAYIIPCHRVLQSSGKIGGYHWGVTRKTAMIGWEASIISPDNQQPTRSI
jgi:AraC family transcriptional regulator, regulatory protein of adaptative response / methylated-DNA-[protein]-cysteine methyltransferase